MTNNLLKSILFILYDSLIPVKKLVYPKASPLFKTYKV